MEISECTVGLAMTGSFCTFEKMIHQMEELKNTGATIIPIFSANAARLDNRFGKANDFCKRVEQIAGRKGIDSIPEAEPIGPKAYLDVLVIAPCTGNTLAKLANGITDTAVLMAAKAHLRNGKPLVISLSTNDALGINFKNIGILMAMKHIYFVPFGQDDYQKKPNSMVAKIELLQDTIQLALREEQIQPVIY
ncbi:MAG TPA: dipicolinate synthase subunit B [Lachnospiraceae bacterium]|nr:dipicolinate synthase subunit B [Lachnospiraceae bacterium]HPF30420.1 dipicolinate synthase subunit B [Lachnospiraceae bacterium]